MSRIFITGSTQGIGHAAAHSLLDQGHEVVLHARSKERASAVNDLAAKPPESLSAICAARQRHVPSPSKSMRSDA